MAYSREVMNFQGERVQALGQQDASGWKGTRQRFVFGYSYASNHPCLIITFRSHKVGASDSLGLPNGCEPWQPWLWVTWFWWKLPDPFGSAMNLMIWDGILVLACFSAECQMCQMCQVAQTSLQPSSFDAKGGTVLLGSVSSCFIVFSHLMSLAQQKANFNPLQMTYFPRPHSSFPIIPNPELKYAQLCGMLVHVVLSTAMINFDLGVLAAQMALWCCPEIHAADSQEQALWGFRSSVVFQFYHVLPFGELT